MKKLLLVFLMLPALALADKWECVNEIQGSGCYTWRMSVPAGWIIGGITMRKDTTYSMTFVPDARHEWIITP